MNRPDRGAIAVVHLARHANGAGPLQQFLQSYATFPAGIGHELLVVLKGFQGDPQGEQGARRAVAAYGANILTVSDEHWDLDTYRAAAEAYASSYYCFLNSFSQIASPGWLETMFELATRSGIGIVGATGSCESVFTDEIDLLRGAVRAHADKLRRSLLPAHSPPRPESKGQQISTSNAIADNAYGQSAAVRKPFRAMALYWNGLRKAGQTYRHFAPFPNHHVRTNGFLLSKEVLRKIEWPRMETKLDAYRFESGRRGLTSQIVHLGLEPVIVGKDRCGYFRNDWHTSETFWQGEQENLLIEDNQTRQYKEGSSELRSRLCRFAWGSLRSSEHTSVLR